MTDIRPSHPQALFDLDHRRAAQLLQLGRLIGVFSVSAFFVLLLFEGVPRSISVEQWETTAQAGILVATALGLVLSWRFEGIGAGLLMIGGVTLGVLASIAYSPPVAFLAALAFVTPGTLIALHWQRRVGRIPLFALLLAVGSMLGAGGYASNRVYDYYNGPTHPESVTAAFPDGPVEWTWAGALTSHGFVVKAVLEDDARGAELLVSPNADLSEPKRIPGANTYRRDDELWTFEVDDLAPGRQYWWAIEVDGAVDVARTGTTATAPSGPATFTFAVGSCLRTESNGQVFDAIRDLDPLFFILDGDYGYEDLVTTDPLKFGSVYGRNVSRPAQQSMLLATPLVYVWDDHDYGGNDADRYSLSRAAVREAYDQYVPHYRLTDVDGPIFQAFTVGRVRFLITDTRSARDPETSPPTMLGDQQKAWLKRELLAARDTHALIVLVNGVPWIAPEQEGADHWAGFAQERAELATFIDENGIENLVMLSGDAHMVAIDDGSNNTFAASGEPGFPVFHAAALDRRGKVKGGPYSEGAIAGGGQFGLVTVTDVGGDTVDVLLSGRDYTGAEILRYEFSVSTR